MIVKELIELLLDMNLNHEVLVNVVDVGETNGFFPYESTTEPVVVLEVDFEP